MTVEQELKRAKFWFGFFIVAGIIWAAIMISVYIYSQTV